MNQRFQRCTTPLKVTRKMTMKKAPNKYLSCFYIDNHEVLIFIPVVYILDIESVFTTRVMNKSMNKYHFRIAVKSLHYFSDILHVRMS